MCAKSATQKPTVEETPSSESIVIEAIEVVEQAAVEAPVRLPYDPTSKLITVKGGAKYLQVRDRLVWLREEHPAARIETYLIEYYADREMWVVRAEVSFMLDDGSQALGTGLGQETEADFRGSALEKAETKAIGRALATLGYGTQFALEMDEGNLADTPAQRSQLPSGNNGQQASNGKLTAAGVEALRADVIALLEVDTDAAQKLPKGAGEMTELELSKTIIWLRNRADRV